MENFIYFMDGWIVVASCWFNSKFISFGTLEWKLMMRCCSVKETGWRADLRESSLDFSHFLIKQLFNYSFTDSLPPPTVLEKVMFSLPLVCWSVLNAT